MPNDIEFMKYKKGNKITKRFIYAYLNVKKLNKQSKYFNANIILNNDNSDLCNVKFWSKEWYNMLCGNIKNSYIGDLISYGYDGIFIDGIEDD
jgi:endo-alpha-1,4-polygalactosaminidase (GH114 family)